MSAVRKLPLLLVALAGVVLVWLALRESASVPPRTFSSVHEPHETIARPQPRPIDDDTARVARARWEDRRARIEAAHRRDAREPSSAPAPSSRDCVDGECSQDAAEHVHDALFASFVEETTTLTQGCEELLGASPTSVRIEARLIGAPDIGTIVESVVVSGGGEDVDALTECLREGMYTLELGEAATNFQRDTALTHGLLDDVASKGWLPPEQVAEVRQQMIDGGLDPAKDPMVAVHAGDPSPTQ